MGLSIADFDICITPSFSKAGKTASASASVRNVVKMAINSKNSEVKRQQLDKNRGRSFQELASQYRSVSEENPKVANFFEDTGRGDEMCSSPRVSAHWRLKHDWEVDGAPTVFQRVVKWQEPDAAAMVKRPTGVDLDVASDEKTEIEAHQTIRPSPCFTAVPRGRRPAELFDDKGSIPPVGFYNPRETLVATRTNVSTKFLYPKVGCPRTPLTREQIHEQYPLSRPASAAGSYKSRPATPGNLSATMQGDADGDATQILALDATEDISAGVTDTAVRTTTGAKSRSRSPSPSGSWFFNKSDRIICAEPMYREVIVPKEEYNVDKGWAMLERHQPSVSLKVVGRDDTRQEQYDRIYPGAWADKRSVRGALPMGKTTGRDRPASGSSISAAVINSVEFVESLPFKSERARPASVDFKRLTGRNAPVITKLAIAAPQPMDVVYNPQLNFVRQRFATPVPFAKMPGRSPPRHFSATGAEERPMVYDSLKAFEFVATRSKSPVNMSKSPARPSTAKDSGGNPRYDWAEAFYKTVGRDRSPVNMSMQLARPSMVAAARAEPEVVAGRASATLTRSKRPSTAMR